MRTLELVDRVPLKKEMLLTAVIIIQIFSYKYLVIAPYVQQVFEPQWRFQISIIDHIVTNVTEHDLRLLILQPPPSLQEWHFWPLKEHHLKKSKQPCVP